MGDDKLDIASLEIGVYHKGQIYHLGSNIVSKRFIPETNIFKTVAKFSFGKIETLYIPSMLKKDTLYVVNKYRLKKEETLDFLYLFSMNDKNGIITHNKNKDYYKYNEDIYLKNLRNNMVGYIIPSSNLEEVKLEKIGEQYTKYENQRVLMVSNTRKGDSDRSDILEIKYGKDPEYLGFASGDNLVKQEKKYWKDWFKPIPIRMDKTTEKIVKRFLVYLKTTSESGETYTNIGLNERPSREATLNTAISFFYYGYKEDSKNILVRILERENDFDNLRTAPLSSVEVKETYVFLRYIEETKDIEFYNEYWGTISKKVKNILEKIKEDEKSKNILSKGYEFETYYYAYNLMSLYRKLSGDSTLLLEEIKLRNYIMSKFISRDGIKKYILDKKPTYLRWEYLVFYSKFQRNEIMEEIYRNSIFRRYPYFSYKKVVEIDRNIEILHGLYTNDQERFGDINLIRLNEDILRNSMKIPSRVYLGGKPRYKVNGIDIYLSSKYLNLIYNRGKIRWKKEK
jgi:hypothetical protein